MAWAIAFGVVIFTILSLLTTAMFTVSTRTKIVAEDITRNTDLDQIGEYFIRAVGTSSLFPNGTFTSSTDVSDYSQWMDEEARQFFIKCSEEYGYTFSSERTTEKGKFRNFYRDETYFRRLTVTQNGTQVLSIIVAEELSYDEKGWLLTRSSNPVTTFKIVEWTTNDTAGEMEDDRLNLLQWVWNKIGSFFNVTEDVPDVYAVRYEANGGLVNDSATSFAYYNQNGSPVILPFPEYSGYDFQGWYDAASGGNKVGEGGEQYVPKGNVILYAHWQAQPEVVPEYTVTFNANGGSCGEKSKKGSSINPISLPSAGRGGYTFGGWYTEGGIQVQNPYTPQSNVTLIAKWTANTYSVYDDLGVKVGSYTVSDKSQTLSLSPSAKTGYSCDSWNSVTTNTSGGSTTVSGKNVTVPANAYGNITLKANRNIVSYNVKMNDGNGTISTLGTYTVEAGVTYQLRLDDRSGYSFNGWSISSNSSPASSLSSSSSTQSNAIVIPTGATGDVTVTAAWKKNSNK